MAKKKPPAKKKGRTLVGKVEVSGEGANYELRFERGDHVYRTWLNGFGFPRGPLYRKPRRGYSYDERKLNGRSKANSRLIASAMRFAHAHKLIEAAVQRTRERERKEKAAQFEAARAQRIRHFGLELLDALRDVALLGSIEPAVAMVARMDGNLEGLRAAFVVDGEF